MNQPTDAGPEMDREIKKILNKPGGLATVGYYSTSPAWAVTGLMWFCEANGCEWVIDSHARPTMSSQEMPYVIIRQELRGPRCVIARVHDKTLPLAICRAILVAAEKISSKSAI